MKLLVAFLVVVLSGCATPSGEPSLQDVMESSRGFVVYNKTGYFESDFRDGGILRTIKEYDYAVESSPCTVLGEVYVALQYNDGFYRVSDKEGRALIFQCRRMSFDHKVNRLFLVGSAADCSTRTRNYGSTFFSGSRHYAKFCSQKQPTKHAREIHTTYTQMFH